MEVAQSSLRPRGILQARILEWVAFPFPRASSQPRGQTQVSCITGRYFTAEPLGKPKNTGLGRLSPAPADLPDPGIEQGSSALQANSLPTELSGKSLIKYLMGEKAGCKPLRRGSPCASVAKNPGRPGFHSWAGKISCRRKQQPTPVCLPEEFHEHRSQVGYSPWAHKESDTTEQLR